MFQKLTSLLLALCLAAGLAACGGGNSSTSSSSAGSGSSQSPSSSSSLLEADFKTLLDDIYKGYEDVMGVQDIEGDAAADILGLEEGTYDQLAARQSLARFNIGDVVIVRPTEGNTEAVKEKLEAYRKSKEELFQNYNVGGDYEKAQNAEIYEQGGYVVLVMFGDNEPAKKLIDGLLGK